MEKINSITIEGKTIDRYENPTFIAPHSRGIIRINSLDRLSIYKELFDQPDSEVEFQTASNYVYLMLNKRNNYIKIGKSKNPLFREKTLQSDEPEIELIVAWNALPIVEKELHKLFAKKRKRGEWFKIQLSNMKIIHKHMKAYRLMPNFYSK